MLPDYYRVLSLPPTASAAEIRQAYRRLAAQRHPDQGGSHTAFLELSEAYLVLSDPAARQRYDEARQNQRKPELQEAVTADRAQARRSAEQYPRDSDDLDQWLDAVARDFQNARYSSPDGYFPKVDDSVSGSAFAVAGGLLGAVFSGAFVVFYLASKPEFRSVGMLLQLRVLAILSLPVAAGAWAGIKLHQAIGGGITLLRGPRSRPLATPTNVGGDSLQRPDENSAAIARSIVRIIACGACGQRLRLPAVQRELIVTCPKCRAKFTYGPG